MRDRIEARVRELGEIILVPAYVSLVGSQLHNVTGRAPQDVDFVYREHPGCAPERRESLHYISRHVLDPEQTGEPLLHEIFNPAGPYLTRDHAFLPLYDLVLRPVASFTVVRFSRPGEPVDARRP